jgi:hypothetical protein
MIEFLIVLFFAMVMLGVMALLGYLLARGVTG